MGTIIRKTLILIMVKFLKPGKVVLVLNGRYAGKKAVIIKSCDDGTSHRPYGHALVVGLSKLPRKVTRTQPSRLQSKKAALKAFTKIFNYKHLMPTRYTLGADDLKSNLSIDVNCNVVKKSAMRKECQKILEQKLKTGKNKWFFSKLRI